MEPHTHVVVLGGGITGLSAAFHLARAHPDVHVTLLEQQPRFGGWVRSARVSVQDPAGHRADVLLEAGPRTLRPNAKSVLELIHLLDLREDVLATPRASPAGRNRFLHVPPAPGLQALPSSLLSALTLPLGRLALGAALCEPLTPANRPADNDGDESVDAFLARRFGADFARTLGSALVHGVYGADARRLSVRAAFPALCASEARGRGSVVWGELGPRAWFAGAPAATDGDDDGWELGCIRDAGWEAKVRGAAVLSFRGGMETLVRALVRVLEGFANVTLRCGAAARALRQDAELNFEVDVDGDASPLRATDIISALPLPALAALLPAHEPLPHLLANPFSTVTVLNLVFPAPAPDAPPLHPPGFGYLIPRPAAGYPAPPDAGTAPPGLLGVVFDSASMPGQDEDGARFVKLTAMLGGPYPLAPTLEADDGALLAAVLPQLAAQLGGALPAPAHYAVHRNTRSIPTYLVGHRARMDALHDALRDAWGGRMKVVGAGVGGVSVADCVKGGRTAAREVAADIDARREG